MPKKKTRLEEMQDYARDVGLGVKTWSPGDGTTRYRFFVKPVPTQTYFGPANGIHTALGLKDAWNFLYGYGSGSHSDEGNAHATRRKIDPQEARHRLEAAGIDFSQNFAVLRSSDVERIVDMARATGYKKRKDAPGSTGRMYFQYLARQTSHAAKRGAAAIDRRKIRYTTLAWHDPSAPTDRRHREGSYPSSDVPKVLETLRHRGIDLVYVDDKPTQL